MEVFVPELRVDPVLLGQADTGLQVTTRIEARHPDEESCPDGYWAAYIVKGRCSTRARVSITVSGPDAWSIVDSLGGRSLGELRALRRLSRRQGVGTLRRPDPLSSEQAEFVLGSPPGAAVAHPSARPPR